MLQRGMWLSLIHICFKPKEGTIVLGLKNLMNKKELESKLQECGIAK